MSIAGRLGFEEPIRRLLCLAAHADDIEIGALGLVWRLVDRGAAARFVVMTGDRSRHSEAEESVRSLVGEAADLACLEHEDGSLPYGDPAGAKRWLAETVNGYEPDLVVVPSLLDSHQDHRFVAELAYQLCRRQTILEYEIPKLESDLGATNVFVPLTEREVARKLEHLERHFRSQQHHHWYRREVFEGVLALRGVQCRAPSGFAEGFVTRMAVLV